MARVAGRAAREAESQRTHRYRLAVARRVATGWLKETSKTLALAISLVLLGVFLHQLGLVAEGQKFEFDPFKPLEFWRSFTGLVLEWSQFDERLLWLLATVFATLAIAAYVRWRRARHAEPARRIADRPWLRRLARWFDSTGTLRLLILLSFLFLGAAAYQEFLWRVVLPVPRGVIGIAFSRPAFSAVSGAQLEESLADLGHAHEIVVRELPVQFNPDDAAQGRALAQRIGARALVLLRETDAAAGAGGSGIRYEAVVVFSDPSIGLDVPLPLRDASGVSTGVLYRTKEGIEAPRLDASDATRLLEAAAGLLLFDQDEVARAAVHLRAALAPPGIPSDAMDPLIEFYLGSAYWLLEDDAEAETAIRAAVVGYRARSKPGLVDTIQLIRADNSLATILLEHDDPDGARSQLDDALDLQGRVAQDAAALADPAIYRRAHESFADTFLGLLAVANDLRDKDEAELWASRAVDEAGKLAALVDDRRAKVRGSRDLYLAGDCATAYKIAYQIIDDNPADPIARRLVVRLASLRDRGEPASLEAAAQLRGLIGGAEGGSDAVKTDGAGANLSDLLLLQIQVSLRASVEDRGYFDDLAQITDRILAVDPRDEVALADYVDEMRVYLGDEILVPASLVPAVRRDVGHRPTFAFQQAEWRHDAATMRSLLAQGDAIRRYAVRLTSEVAPGTTKPVLELARLTARELLILAEYAYPPEPKFASLPRDATLQARVFELGDSALADAGRVLVMPNADPLDLAEAHILRAEILLDLWYPWTVTNIALARDAAVRAVADAEAALQAMGASTDTADSFLVARIYGTLVRSYNVAAWRASNLGDEESKNLYLAKARAANQQQDEAITREQQDLMPVDARLGRCSSKTSRAAAAQLLAEGKLREARDAYGAYLADFPRDPAALIDAGWTDYLLGDLSAAAATTAAAETADPTDPIPAGNTAVISLAQGANDAATAASLRFVSALNNEPPGSRLNDLAAFASDLDGLAHSRTGTRSEAAGIVAILKSEVTRETSEAGQRYASVAVAALDGLGLASLRAGDREVARELFDRGVSIAPTYAPIYAHRAILAVLSSEDVDASLRDAIATARRYTELPDDPVLWLAAARRDLERAAADCRSFKADAPAVARSLEDLAHKLEVAAGSIDPASADTP
jgi:hypothetical protein